MYGEKCLAVVFTEMQHALRFAFGISPEYADGHLWLVLNHRPEVDDCGRGVVLYFRNVAPVVPIWDDEEDDDC